MLPCRRWVLRGRAWRRHAGLSRRRLCQWLQQRSGRLTLRLPVPICSTPTRHHPRVRCCVIAHGVRVTTLVCLTAFLEHLALDIIPEGSAAERRRVVEELTQQMSQHSSCPTSPAQHLKECP